MSEGTADNRNRLRFLITIAVLVGALILLLATEWGAITGSVEPAPPPAVAPTP